jgi:DNA-binding LytR/AlgR family response regulator
MKLKCLIVEDEPIARKGMEEYVHDIPFLELIGSCESALAGHTISFRKQDRSDVARYSFASHFGD